MERLILYPFTYEHRELLTYRENIRDYEIVSYIVPNIAERIVFEKHYGESQLEYVSGNFKKGLQNSDTVLLLDTKRLDISKQNYLEKIKIAEESGKKLLVMRELVCKLGKAIQQFEILEDSLIHEEMEDKNEPLYLKGIDIPAIGVMGLGDFCNKFYCEYEISSYFREKGYSVLHVGSKQYAPLLNGVQIPQMLYDKNLSVTERIVKFNHWIFNLCEGGEYDLVVIGMPGGIMPLNNKVLNDFGEISYIMANAVSFDQGVLCSYFYERVDEHYFTEYKNYCKYKLNCDIDSIAISNSACRFNLDSRESVLEYLHYYNDMPERIMIDGTEKFEIGLYNILQEESKKNLVEHLYEKLTDGVCAF